MVAAVVIAAWLAAALLAGLAGVFVAPPGAPSIALGLAAGLPPLLVLAAAVFSSRVRAWIRGLDLRFLTLLQAWRVAGFAILALYAAAELPARFALPAGIGDMLIGFSAPLTALYLTGNSKRWQRPGYIGWTLLGIVDLVLAVSLGVTTPTGMEPMSVIPMSLIPTFGVPLTLVLHVMCLVNLTGKVDSPAAVVDPAAARTAVA
ncbi:hypothetical protein [Pseudonocardia sp. TRM90224]|uniref:hypothetical protein n=1 Tax=Pseudonocardia sp. TRM90224 TaxID=2812678 RepID=UPI001E4A5854|nr:hypothetical protein [Pseudonocardia sp. TRM90224]